MPILWGQKLCQSGEQRQSVMLLNYSSNIWMILIKVELNRHFFVSNTKWGRIRAITWFVCFVCPAKLHWQMNGKVAAAVWSVHHPVPQDLWHSISYEPGTLTKTSFYCTHTQSHTHMCTHMHAHTHTHSHACISGDRLVEWEERKQQISMQKRKGGLSDLS